MASNGDRIDGDRLSVVSGGLLLALALGRLWEMPAGRYLGIEVLGSPLGVDLSGSTLFLLMILGLAVTGMESLLQLHPVARQTARLRSSMFWILPALAAVGLAGGLWQIEAFGLWVLALGGAAVLLPLTLAAEYMAVSPERRQDERLQWAVAALIHIIALLLFAVIYGAGLRSLLGSPLIMVATTLLAARLFWPHAGSVRVAFFYGVVPGLLAGQLNWILNYWSLSSLEAGSLLLVLFYVVAGLLDQYLRKSLTRQVSLEYLAGAAVALVLIFLAVP